MGLCSCIGGCVLGIFRWALFVFNLIFVVASIALITIGTIILVNISSYDEFYEDNAKVSAIILISTGALTFLVAFLGCCGTLKKSSCMVYTYAGVLFVMFAAQLAGGIITFVYKDSFQTELVDKMYDLVDDYNEVEGARNVWDRIQIDYKCCGVTSPGDWATEIQGVPESCKCFPGSEDCQDVPILGDIYTVGCYTKLEPTLRDLVDAMGGIAIAVSLLDLVAGIFAVCLANSFKKGRRRGSDSS